MVGSFSSGLSGLNTNAVYLSVIGNNLANINTIGFKSSSVTFMDLVSQSAGGSSTNPMQIGPVLRESGLRVSYLGTGQRVPDDLLRAMPETLAAVLLGDVHTESAA